MLARYLRDIGLSSDVMHVAALLSIGGSIATWARAKRSGDIPHAERFGIFIGLWAPTFFALGNLIATAEEADR